MKVSFSASGTVLEGHRNCQRRDLAGTRSLQGGASEAHTQTPGSRYSPFCSVMIRGPSAHIPDAREPEPPESVSQHKATPHLVSNDGCFNHKILNN